LLTGDPVLDFALSLRDPALTKLMEVVSEANSETVYIGLLPVIYWLYSRRVGFVLLMSVAFATFAAVAIKNITALPRPPNDPALPWLDDPSTLYAFPSGHVTAGAATWFSLAALLRSPKVAAFGALVVASVSFSRLYLGVHWTRDVVGAAALGIACGAVLWVGLPHLERAVGRLSLAQRLALVSIFPALALIDHSPESLMILSAAGGAAAGEVATRHLDWTMKTGDLQKLPWFGILRLLIGVPVLGALAIGLGDPLQASAFAVVLRFSALGVFTTLLGPRIFTIVEAKVARAERAPKAAT
jgi:membrane-associated phospholipid phosphatase